MMSFKRLFAALAILAASAALSMAPAQADPLHVVALGDSLTAGYGLEPGQSFPERLEAALRKKGYEVDVANAGVSGDTTADGLARLDWSVPDGTDLVILELGANDALRGVESATVKQNLDVVLARLKARGVPVLLAGMLAPPNMGESYTRAFDSIYPDLAKKYGVPLYPFFLDGVATRQELLLEDGMHPTAAGVERIVERILPAVEAALPARHG